MRWLVRHFSKRGDRVLSLFDGTGTTTVAALMEGRHCVGVDYCTEMHQQAAFRVQNFLRTEKVLAESLSPPETTSSAAPRPVVSRMEVRAKVFEMLEEAQGNVEEEVRAVMSKARPYIHPADEAVFEDYVKIAMPRNIRTALPSYDRQRLLTLCGSLSRSKMIWNINMVLREQNSPPKAHALRVTSGEGEATEVLNPQYPPADEKYPDVTVEEVREERDRYIAFLLYGEHKEEFKVDAPGSGDII